MIICDCKRTDVPMKIKADKLHTGTIYVKSTVLNWGI